MAAALTMKESVFCWNMTKDLGFGTHFDSIPQYIDNVSDLERRRQPDVQLASKTRGSAVLLHPETGQGGQNLHPLREDGGSTRWHRHQVS